MNWGHNRTNIIIAILAVIATGLIFYKFSIPEKIQQAGENVVEKYIPQEVSKIIVINGSEFDILLVNNKRFKGILKVTAASDAKKQVVNLINSSTKPRVIRYEQIAGSWIVDIILENNGKDIDLATWLRDNKLVYEEKL